MFDVLCAHMNNPYDVTGMLRLMFFFYVFDEIDVLLLCLCFIISLPFCVPSCPAILSQEDHNGNKSQTLLCVILHDLTNVHAWLFQVLCVLVFFKWSNE